MFPVRAKAPAWCVEFPSLTLNKATSKIDSGVGSFTYILQNDTGDFTMDGSLEVTSPNVLEFTLNGDEFFVLDLN